MPYEKYQQYEKTIEAYTYRILKLEYHKDVKAGYTRGDQYCQIP